MNTWIPNVVVRLVFLASWLNFRATATFRVVLDDTPNVNVSSEILDLWKDLNLNESELVRLTNLTPSIELPPSNDVIGWTKKMCLNETSAYQPFGYVWVPAGHDVPCSSYCGQGNKEAFLFDGILNHAPIASKRCITHGSSVPNGRWTWRHSHEHEGRCACKYGFHYTLKVDHSGAPKWMCRREHSHYVRAGKRYIHCDP